MKKPDNGSAYPSPYPQPTEPTRSGFSPTRVGLFVLGGVVILAAILVLLLLREEDEPVARGACGLVIDVTGQPGPEWTSQTLEAGWEELANDACTDRMVFANLVTDNSKAIVCDEVARDSYPGDNDNKQAQEDDRDLLWLKTSEVQEDSEGEALVPIWGDMEEMRTCGLYGPGQDPATATPLEFEGSDILTAIDVSQELMGDVAGPKSLFILSDMINSMPPVAKMPKSDQIDAAVEDLDAAGLIPDMSGIEVTVIGVGTNSSTNPQKLQDVEQFWTQFFDAADAEDVDFEQAIT